MECQEAAVEVAVLNARADEGVPKVAERPFATAPKVSRNAISPELPAGKRDPLRRNLDTSPLLQ
jgi:hypothetical protein